MLIAHAAGLKWWPRARPGPGLAIRSDLFGGGVGALAVGDMDGDEAPDLVVATGDGVVWLSLNSADDDDATATPSGPVEPTTAPEEEIDTDNREGVQRCLRPDRDAAMVLLGAGAAAVGACWLGVVAWMWWR